jgi:muconolactone D-isomerase
LSLDQLRDEWEKEAEATLGAMEAGKVVALYKVSGQRRVIGILDVKPTDELDKTIMASLPIAHHWRSSTSSPCVSTQPSPKTSASAGAR